MIIHISIEFTNFFRISNLVKLDFKIFSINNNNIKFKSSKYYSAHKTFVGLESTTMWERIKHNEIREKPKALM